MKRLLSSLIAFFGAICVCVPQSSNTNFVTIDSIASAFESFRYSDVLRLDKRFLSRKKVDLCDSMASSNYVVQAYLKLDKLDSAKFVIDSRFNSLVSDSSLCPLEWHYYLRSRSSLNLKNYILKDSRLWLKRAIKNYSILDNSLKSDDKLIDLLLDDISLLIAEADYDLASNRADTVSDLIIRNKHIEPIVSVRLNHLLGRINMDLGNFREAEQYYMQAMRIRGKHHPNDRIVLGLVQNDLGVLFSRMDQLNRAVEYLEQAIIILRRVYGDENINIARSYDNIAICYARMRKYDEAIHYFEKSETYKYNLFGNDHVESSNSQNNLGLCYSRMGEFDKSYSYLKKALVTRIKILPKNHPLIAQTIRNLAVTNYNEGNYDKSLALHEEAYKMRKSSLPSNHPHIMASKFLMSQTYLAKGELVKARYLMDQLADELGYNFLDPRNFNKTYEPNLTVSLLFNNCIYQEKLSSTRSTADYARIHDAYESVISYFDYLAYDLSYHFANKVSYYQMYSVYEFAIKNLLEDGSKNCLDRAYKLSEKIKVRSFLDKLNNSIEINNEFFDSLYSSEKIINGLIYTNQKKLHSNYQSLNEDEIEIDSLMDNVVELKSKRELLHLKIKEKYPNYFYLQHSRSIVKIDDVRSSLQPEECIVEYFLGDSVSAVFIITRDTFMACEIASKNDIVQLVQSVNTAINESARNTSIFEANCYLDTYIREAKTLYNYLLRPIKPHLKRKLIIIPEADLNYLSFETLLTSDVEDMADFSNYPFLLKEHMVSYNYAAYVRSFVQQSDDLDRGNKLFAAYAPDFSKGIQANPGTLQERQINSQLLYNQKEVRQVNAIMDGDAYLSENATVDRIISNLHDYKIHHFATHGGVHDEDSDYSYIQLSGDNDADIDSKLYTLDIYGGSTNADLITLSACYTGAGVFERGYGVKSIAQGFSLAGAKSVLTTLWGVSDLYSLDIMNNFYSLLRNENDKSEALSTAKLKAIEANGLSAHPYYWGSYVLYGDTEPILSNSKSVGWNKILVLIVAFIFLMIGLRWFWRRKFS